jgi:sec-independent protein translocase protein TatB
MFDVGFTEIVLIFVIGLVILGPERLPRVATKIGRWVGRARRTATQLRHQLEREIALSDINQPPPRRKPPPQPDRPADESKDGADDASGEGAASGESATDAGAQSADVSGTQPSDETNKTSNDPPAA